MLALLKSFIADTIVQLQCELVQSAQCRQHENSKDELSVVQTIFTMRTKNSETAFVIGENEWHMSSKSLVDQPF